MEAYFSIQKGENCLPLERIYNVSQVYGKNFLPAAWGRSREEGQSSPNLVPKVFSQLQLFLWKTRNSSSISTFSPLLPPSLLRSLSFGSKLMTSIWKHRLTIKHSRANKRGKKNEPEQSVGPERPTTLWYKTKYLFGGTPPGFLRFV